jgi:hypothetical protein
MKTYVGKMDVRGVHAQKCKAMQHLAINTHDMVKDELITMLKQCGVFTRAEPNNALLLAGLGDRGKPDFVTRTMGGGRTAYDLRSRMLSPSTWSGENGDRSRGRL